MKQLYKTTQLKGTGVLHLKLMSSGVWKYFLFLQILIPVDKTRIVIYIFL